MTNDLKIKLRDLLQSEGAEPFGAYNVDMFGQHGQLKSRILIFADKYIRCMRKKSFSKQKYISRSTYSWYDISSIEKTQKNVITFSFKNLAPKLSFVSDSCDAILESAYFLLQRLLSPHELKALVLPKDHDSLVSKCNQRTTYFRFRLFYDNNGVSADNKTYKRFLKALKLRKNIIDNICFDDNKFGIPILLQCLAMTKYIREIGFDRQVGPAVFNFLTDNIRNLAHIRRIVLRMPLTRDFAQNFLSSDHLRLRCVFFDFKEEIDKEQIANISDFVDSNSQQHNKINKIYSFIDNENIIFNIDNNSINNNILNSNILSNNNINNNNSNSIDINKNNTNNNNTNENITNDNNTNNNNTDNINTNNNNTDNNNADNNNTNNNNANTNNANNTNIIDNIKNNQSVENNAPKNEVKSVSFSSHTSIGFCRKLKISDLSKILKLKGFQKYRLLELNRLKNIDLSKIGSNFQSLFALSLINCKMLVGHIFSAIETANLINLRQLNISGNIGSNVIDSISLPPNLYKIHANKIQWNADSFKNFILICSKKSSSILSEILELSVSFTTFIETDWSEMSDCLLNLNASKLTKFSFDQNLLSDILFNQLLKCEKLKYLSICNNVTNENISMVSNFVKQSKSLKELNIKGSTADLSSFFTIVGKSIIKSIDISNNRILNDESFLLLPQMIIQNENLEFVAFDGGCISSINILNKFFDILECRTNPIKISYPKKIIKYLSESENIDDQAMEVLIYRFQKMEKQISSRVPHQTSPPPFERPFDVFYGNLDDIFPSFLSSEDINSTKFYEIEQFDEISQNISSLLNDENEKEDKSEEKSENNNSDCNQLNKNVIIIDSEVSNKSGKSSKSNISSLSNSSSKNSKNNKKKDEINNENENKDNDSSKKDNNLLKKNKVLFLSDSEEEDNYNDIEEDDAETLPLKETPEVKIEINDDQEYYDIIEEEEEEDNGEEIENKISKSELSSKIESGKKGKSFSSSSNISKSNNKNSTQKSMENDSQQIISGNNDSQQIISGNNESGASNNRTNIKLNKINKNPNKFKSINNKKNAYNNNKRIINNNNEEMYNNVKDNNNSNFKFNIGNSSNNDSNNCNNISHLHLENLQIKSSDESGFSENQPIFKAQLLASSRTNLINDNQKSGFELNSGKFSNTENVEASDSFCSYTSASLVMVSESTTAETTSTTMTSSEPRRPRSNSERSSSSNMPKNPRSRIYAKNTVPPKKPAIAWSPNAKRSSNWAFPLRFPPEIDNSAIVTSMDIEYSLDKLISAVRNQ